MDDYVRGYLDALKFQEEHHCDQSRHYRNALFMPAPERKLHEQKHADEAERLKRQIEELERAAAPVPLQSTLPGPRIRPIRCRHRRMSAPSI